MRLKAHQFAAVDLLPSSDPSAPQDLTSNGSTNSSRPNAQNP
jgi:hypothetical protein